MEHTNLFLYESEADFLADYPEGKMDQPVPGVAYIRGEEGELGTLHTNREVTTYEITIHSTNKSGTTVAPDKVIETNPVLDGNTVKMNVVADPVEGYKPRHEVEKVTFTSASTEHTIIYLAPTSYTVTVNYMYSGETIAPSSAIVIDDVFEEDVVMLRIEPVIVAGYSASPVTISVSGDMTYNLEYVVSGPVYEYVDLDLPSGTLWATCNVGASSPEEYGGYFAWGETTPKESYIIDNYAWYNPSTRQYTKYSGGSDFNLEISDDAAAFNMGGDWHMPTATQIGELMEYCTFSLTTYNDVPGIEYTSNNNGETLFFPGNKVVGENAEDITAVYFQSALTWSSCGGVSEIEAGKVNAMGQCFDVYDGTPEKFAIDLFYGMPVRGVIGDSPSPEPEPGTIVA